MTDLRPRSLSVQVVSITGYLIGVKEEIFSREYKTSIFQTLETKPDAKIMRCLCMARTTLIKNYGQIVNKFRNEAFFNIDKMPEYLDPAIFTYLHDQGIDIIKSNPKPMQYIIAINKLINDRVQTLKPLFPMWVEWDYIRKLFQMPKGGNEKEISKLITEFRESTNSYPYHCYINWPIHDPSAYSDDPEDNDNLTTGNVLQNDRRFLVLLYHINGATFSDFRFISDIGDGTKNELESFLTSCEKIVLAVDCENSDPYKLCAVLGGLREAAFRASRDPLSTDNADCFDKIQKIILFDDVHTIDAWDILKNYVSVPIEHIQTERVSNHKSLVDIQMTAGVAKEHYAEGVDGFLLASSDSDFWGLIKSLPTAKFMVLLEKDKYGQALIDTLELNSIGYCIIDHFAGNTDSIKTGALDQAVVGFLGEYGIDLESAVERFYDDLRVNLTEKQKQNYWNRLVKKLGVEVSDGVIRVVVK